MNRLKKTVAILLAVFAGTWLTAADTAKENAPFRQALTDYRAGKISPKELRKAFAGLRELDAERSRIFPEWQKLQSAKTALYDYALQASKEKPEIQFLVKADMNPALPDTTLEKNIEIYKFFQDNPEFRRLDMARNNARLAYGNATLRHYYSPASEDSRRLFDDFQYEFSQINNREILKTMAKADVEGSEAYRAAIAQLNKLTKDSPANEKKWAIANCSGLLQNELDLQSPELRAMLLESSRASNLFYIRRCEILLEHPEFSYAEYAGDHGIPDSQISSVREIFKKDAKLQELVNVIKAKRDEVDALRKKLIEEEKYPAAKELKMFEEAVKETEKRID